MSCVRDTPPLRKANCFLQCKLGGMSQRGCVGTLSEGYLNCTDQMVRVLLWQVLVLAGASGVLTVALVIIYGVPLSRGAIQET